MSGSSNHYKKYIHGAAVLVAAYLVSLFAWLDTRGELTLIPRFLAGRPIEAWLGTILLVIDIPGWFVVGDGLATRLTDIVIPILSGAFWGLLVIVGAKLIKLLLRYTRPTVR